MSNLIHEQLKREELSYIEPIFDNQSINIDIKEEFGCNICISIKPKLLSPIECNHLVCEDCYNELFRVSNHNRCSVCRIYVTKWCVMHIINRIIGNINVKCPVLECGQNQKFHKFSLHYKNCPNRRTQCRKNNCDWVGPFSQLEKHNLECEWVYETCQHCNNLFIRGACKQHEKICNLAIRPCPVCQVIVPIWKLESGKHHCS